MSTYGQAFISEINESLQLLSQLTIQGYENTDIKSILNKVASSTELFLKREVFPAKSNRDNFFSYINELKYHSIRTEKVDFIHDVRLAYNESKHDPNFVISAIRVNATLQNLLLSIQDIVAAGIGRVNTAVRAENSRVFWICAWDHYTGGETEVVVFLPSDYDGFLGAKSLDRVSIHGLKWDEFKSDLPNFGVMNSHEGLIPEGQVEFWLSEGDCLTPFVFEGEYNSLIICLSKYLKNVELIPGLAREDDATNLLQTAVMAVCDAYASNPTATKEEQRANALSLANSQYAVLPKFNDRIEIYLDKIIGVIDSAPSDVKSTLTGPIWIAAEAYSENESTYRDESIRVLVDSKNRVALGV